MDIRAIIGARFLASKEAQPRSAPFDVRDMRLPGFLLRVQPSGARAYVAQIGRGRRITFARVGVLAPDQARDRCQLILGNVAHGRDPLYGIDGATTITLREFIDSTYAPWVKANRPRSATQSLQRLETVFGKMNSTSLERLSVEMFEAWKLERFNEVGSSRVDLQACKLEYSIVSPK